MTATPTASTAPATDARVRSRPSLAAALGWSLFIVALAYLLLIGGGYSGINFTPARTLNLGIITLALALWAVLAWRRPEWRPRSAIWPALLLPMIALVLATIASAFPRLALDYLAWAILLVGLYLLLGRLFAQAYVRARIGPVLAFFAMLLSGAYIALVVMHWLEWWELLGRLTAPMLRPAYTGMLIGGPTVVAPLLVLLSSTAVAALGVGSRARRVTVVTIVVLMLAAVLLSGSRAAWAALAVATLVSGLVVVLSQRQLIRGLVADRRVRIGLGIGVVGIVIAGLVLAPALLDRIGRGGDGGRASYVATGQRLFAEAPLLGHGPGTWSARRIAYLEPGELRYHIAHAHNPYVQTLAEMGIVGALAGLAALGVLVWLIVTALRGADRTRWRWGLAALFVLVYLGISFVFDSYWNLPVILAVAALPFAFLDGTARAGIGERWLRAAPRTQARRHALATAGLFAILALAVVGLYRIESVAALNLRAAAAVDARDWDAATELAGAATSEDPAMVPYQVTRALAAAGDDDWATAATAYESAVRVDKLPESWLGLALARHELGAPREDVLAAVEQAREVGGDGPGVLLAAGSLYDRLDMTEEANDAYAGALVVHPSLAAEDGWLAGQVGMERLRAIVAGAIERGGAAWPLALLSGDPAAARTAAGDDTLATLVIAAWDGDAEALEALQQHALERPNDQSATSWAARASARAGDGEAADRFRRIGTFGTEAGAPPGYEIRAADVGEPRPAGSLQLDARYGRELYRRTTPMLLMAPGLPSLVAVDLSEDGTELE